MEDYEFITNLRRAALHHSFFTGRYVLYTLSSSLLSRTHIHTHSNSPHTFSTAHTHIRTRTRMQAAPRTHNSLPTGIHTFRMRIHRSMRVQILPQAAQCSIRRWAKKGVCSNTLSNQIIVILYAYQCFFVYSLSLSPFHPPTLTPSLSLSSHTVFLFLCLYLSSLSVFSLSLLFSLALSLALSLSPSPPPLRVYVCAYVRVHQT